MVGNSGSYGEGMYQVDQERMRGLEQIISKTGGQAYHIRQEAWKGS